MTAKKRAAEVEREYFADDAGGAGSNIAALVERALTAHAAEARLQGHPLDSQCKACGRWWRGSDPCPFCRVADARRAALDEAARLYDEMAEAETGEGVDTGRMWRRSTYRQVSQQLRVLVDAKAAGS